VTPRPGISELKYYTELLFQPRRLTCGGCGAVADWSPEVRGAGLVGVVLAGSEDPFFQRPLWLQTRCVRQILWAYNEEPVVELSDHVGAQLRERGGVRPTRAMFARLPTWMKRSDNRSEVLAGLETLRELTKRTAPADRSDVAHGRGDRPRAHRCMHFRGGPMRPESPGQVRVVATPPLPAVITTDMDFWPWPPIRCSSVGESA
jgi:hypothetical protein